MKTLMPLIVILFLFFACAAKEMRYTSEEIQNFPLDIQEHIRNGEVVFSMTPQHVRYAWGSPTHIRVLSPTKDGKERVEWAYQRIAGAVKTKLYFIDGKLRGDESNDPGLKKRILEE